MKLDIKSVLIGVLFTIGILSVMAFDEKEKEIGRYQLGMGANNFALVMDTTNGEFVKYKFGGKSAKEVDKNPNKLD